MGSSTQSTRRVSFSGPCSNRMPAVSCSPLASVTRRSWYSNTVRALSSRNMMTSEAAWKASRSVRRSKVTSSLPSPAGRCMTQRFCRRRPASARYSTFKVPRSQTSRCSSALSRTAVEGAAPCPERPTESTSVPSSPKRGRPSRIASDLAWSRMWSTPSFPARRKVPFSPATNPGVRTNSVSTGPQNAPVGPAIRRTSPKPVAKRITNLLPWCRTWGNPKIRPSSTRGQPLSLGRSYF